LPTSARTALFQTIQNHWDDVNADDDRHSRQTTPNASLRVIS
jgi:hypothetical protein